jgi:hypothetical protein
VLLALRHRLIDAGAQDLFLASGSVAKWAANWRLAKARLEASRKARARRRAEAGDRHERASMAPTLSRGWVCVPTPATPSRWVLEPTNGGGADSRTLTLGAVTVFKHGDDAQVGEGAWYVAVEDWDGDHVEEGPGLWVREGVKSDLGVTLTPEGKPHTPAVFPTKEAAQRWAAMTLESFDGLLPTMGGGREVGGYALLPPSGVDTKSVL